MTTADLHLLDLDLDRWPELLGYQVPEGSTREEKIELRRQHVESLLASIKRAQTHLLDLDAFAARMAQQLANINAKTEDRVVAIQQRLTAIADALNEEKALELGELVQDVVTKLQFQDIQRQELEAISEALQGLSDFFGEVRGAGDTDIFEMLPDVVASYRPRTDIDAADVDESEAGPAIELF